VCLGGFYREKWRMIFVGVFALLTQPQILTHPPHIKNHPPGEGY